MREILFRGKRKDNGEWVYGDFVNLKDGKKLIPHIYGYGEVIPETVGQYTGLTDYKGNKIFEGDIVDVKYDIQYTGVSAERIGHFEVVFDNGCFMKKNKKGLFHFISSDVCKKVGNIYDNPEILKGGAE